MGLITLPQFKDTNAVAALGFDKVIAQTHIDPRHILEGIDRLARERRTRVEKLQARLEVTRRR